MGEPTPRVFERDRRDRYGDGLNQRFAGTRPGLPDYVLYLRECLLDELTTVHLYTPASSSGHKIIASLRFDPLPMSMVSAG